MSSITRPMHRRRFLRGAGVALSLPWLESLRPATARATETPEPPVRLGVLFMPNGVGKDNWRPEGIGRDYRLSPLLQPLAAYRDQMLVLSNLWNREAEHGDGHYVKTAGLLTSTKITKTTGVELNCNGVSFDQVVAAGVGGATPLPSLELGIEPVATGVDATVGYTRVYGAHLSWKGPRRPLAKEVHPRLAYQRLMRAADPNASAAASNRAVLDFVLEDAATLQGELCHADRQRLEEYLESVRSVESRIERLENQSASTWTPRCSLDPPGGLAEDIPEHHPEHVRLMLDMMVLAFQSDVTRVASFMFGNSVSNINFSFLEGINDGFHNISHHENDPAKIASYQRIAGWHLEQMAYMLGKMQSIREGDRTLLDNSAILFGSDLREGHYHSPHDLPIVVAGSAGGRLATGQHLDYAADTPLANLYLALMQATGVPAESFGDSTGVLPGVLA